MKFVYGQETYRLAYPTYDPSACLYANNAHVSYGLHFAEACAKHLSNTFNASRVYVLCSKSLAANTNALKELEEALGDKVAGERLGMKQHTLWSECVEIVNECREKQVDALITLGAGSLTDAAKLVSLALANDVHESKDLLRLPTATNPRVSPKAFRPRIPVIAIPTSLSGGEYSNFAGATEDATGLKHQFCPPLHGPNIIILDPGLTRSTPERLWLSSGVRAIDHCTETLCSLYSNEPSDALAASGLRALVDGLKRCKDAPDDLDARLQVQLAVIDAMGCCFLHLIHAGASHAIGHMLGPMGVPHGETSCVLLPAVCKYNLTNGSVEEMARQDKILDLLWELDAVKDPGLNRTTADLGDILDRLFRALGMPRSLKEVGVEGSDKLELLAEHSLEDRWCATNPVPLTTKAQVLQILEMVKV